MSYFTANPKKTIAGLTTALLAAGVAVGSGASFSSQTVNPENTFTSGTLLQTNSKNGVAIVTGANLKPGDVKTGTVTIANTGTLAGDFTLVERDRSNPFTDGQLELKIDDVTNPAAPAAVYSGDLGEIATAGITLGRYAAQGDSRTYRFTVTLKQSAPNADQGKTATAAYEFNAVPSANQ